MPKYRYSAQASLLRPVCGSGCQRIFLFSVETLIGTADEDTSGLVSEEQAQLKTELTPLWTDVL